MARFRSNLSNSPRPKRIRVNATARTALLLTSVALPLAFGCTSKSYTSAELFGEVTVDGTPVPEGSIRFMPNGEGQGPAVGASIVNGKYEAKRVPLGDVQVTFSAVQKKQRLPDDASGMQQWKTEDMIPAKYRAGLRTQVSAGNTKQDFQLTSGK